MIKNECKVVYKNGIGYVLKDGKELKWSPWLGDLFAMFYDTTMEKSVFPHKFNASYKKHIQLLQNELKDIHHYTILELAAGSGNLADILPHDNIYVGIDISARLLRIALQK